MNGYRVKGFSFGASHCCVVACRTIQGFIYESEINSIVTKEQFAQAEYKIEKV